MSDAWSAATDGGMARGPVIRALAITISNRASAGVYEDTSGPVLTDLLAEAGCAVDTQVIPDGDAVEQALLDGVASGYQVIVTTGGTGLDAE